MRNTEKGLSPLSLLPHGIFRRGKEDDRTVARKAMLDAYPELRNMYDENDGNTAVFVIDNAVATIYSFTEEPKVYKF